MTPRGIKGKINSFMSSESFIQIFDCTSKHLSVTSFPSLCIKVVCPPLSSLPSSHTLSNVCYYRRQGKFSHYKNRHSSYCLLHFQKAQTCEWKRENEFLQKTIYPISNQTLCKSILLHKVEKGKNKKQTTKHIQIIEKFSVCLGV